MNSAKPPPPPPHRPATSKPPPPPPLRTSKPPAVPVGPATAHAHAAAQEPAHAQAPTPVASVAPPPMVVAHPGLETRLRVSVKLSVRDPNLLLARPLREGEAPPAGTREAVLVLVEPAAEPDPRGGGAST